MTRLISMFAIVLVVLAAVAAVPSNAEEQKRLQIKSADIFYNDSGVRVRFEVFAYRDTYAYAWAQKINVVVEDVIGSHLAVEKEICTSLPCTIVLYEGMVTVIVSSESVAEKWRTMLNEGLRRWREWKARDVIPSICANEDMCPTSRSMPPQPTECYDTVCFDPSSPQPPQPQRTFP